MAGKKITKRAAPDSPAQDHTSDVRLGRGEGGRSGRVPEGGYKPPERLSVQCDSVLDAQSIDRIVRALETWRASNDYFWNHPLPVELVIRTTSEIQLGDRQRLSKALAVRQNQVGRITFVRLP